jgi:hypothetical protein
LKLVQAGKIPKGSALIIEEMDRLSREEATEAIPQFFSIINKDVQIVTLHDGKIYSKKSVNVSLGDRLQSFIDMDQAHQESRKKSDRLKAAWEAKRNGMGARVLSGRCPAWLKRSDDWKGFQKIPDRTKIVQKIFQWRASNQSPNSIVKRLNQSPDVWRPKNGWRKSYIQKILRSRAVIGEYQACRMIDGERQPAGDPTPNYFPSVVSPDLFRSVQEKIRLNRETFKGGRTGRVSNLFAYLIKCGRCGGSVAYVDKGPYSGGGYLICDRAQRRAGCDSAQKWKYDEFERDFLTHWVRSNVSEFLPDVDKVQGEIDQVRQQQSSVQDQLKEAADKIANLSDSIALTKDRGVRETLESKLKLVLEEEKRLKQESQELESRIDSLELNGDRIQEKIESMQKLMSYMKRRSKSREVIDIRLRLREHLRELSPQLSLFPGEKGKRFYRWGPKGGRFTRAWYPVEERNSI